MVYQSPDASHVTCRAGPEPLDARSYQWQRATNPLQPHVVLGNCCHLLGVTQLLWNLGYMAMEGLWQYTWGKE